jgi:hypothetical protein
MPVRWRLASPALMDHQQVINPGGPLTFTGSSDRIQELTAAFESLPRHRLVITGGPGTGKTTLAVQLLLDLLPGPWEPPTSPVPVMFSLTGWAPDTQPRVQEFLTTQLTMTYPALPAIHPDAAAALVDQGRVLPVLDGLDEVTPDRRAAIITALNATLDPTGGVILTSRRLEYRTALEAAGDRLTGAAVIGPYALTPADAVGYLRKHLHPDAGRAWERLLGQIERGAEPALSTLIATPLGLWLLRAVYLDTARDPMLLAETASTPAELQAHLLEQLIPAVVQSRPPLPRRRHNSPDVSLRPTRRYRPDDIERWLTTFAQQLPVGDRNWAWWHLAQHTFHNRAARLAARTTICVTIGLTSGLAGGVAFGLTEGLANGLFWGFGAGLTALLVFGLGIGFPLGLIGAVQVRLGSASHPKTANTRLSGRISELIKSLARGLGFGLALALAVGPAAVVMMALLTGGVNRPGYQYLTVGVIFGLIVGLPGGLVFGLADFLGRGDVAQQAVSPFRSYRGDRTVGLIAAVTGGLAAGLAMGLGSAAWTDSNTALEFGLTAALALGVAFGLACGVARSAWFTFAIAGLVQALLRRLPAPWRVMPMLEDCFRLGLLRTVGPVYQFRHAALQEHLAPPPQTPSP